MHESTYIAGNGNGNKMNRRIEMLEELLKTSHDDGTSARTNSLRQALSRNKSDMADDTTKSLDILRQVFQNDFNEEIKQVIDRHLRTTFTPAFENLRRNGHEVTETDISKLCVAILDEAKSAFLPASEGGEGPEAKRRKCLPAYTSLLKPLNTVAVQPNIPELNMYESDENESDAASLASYNSSLINVPIGARQQLKRRGRPKKADMMDTGRSGTPVMNGRQPISAIEAMKWNPNRFNMESHFVLASKINRLLGFSSRGGGHLFTVHARVFRYVVDDEDRLWMFQRGLTKRAASGGGKLLIMALEDAVEIAEQEGTDHQIRAELQRYAFLAPERMLMKMKAQMLGPYEQLRARVLPGAPLPAEIGSQQQQSTNQQQQPLQQAPNFMPAFQL